MRALTLLLVLCIGVLLTAEVQFDAVTPKANGFAEPLAAPALSVNYASGRISINGTSSSENHEAVLRQLVSEQFPDIEADLEFRPAVLPGFDWETVSARLIYLVGASESAIATLQPGRVEIRGVTSQPDVFESRASFLREHLPPGARFSTDVVVLQSSATFDELCRRAFAGLHLQPVSFHESSAEIRQGSLATLDRITEFARDCPATRIEIRGHTDASGDEAWNRRLSLARARAVADHIVAKGIDPERLIVSGLGSSDPITDNSTARGRETNRRIEFVLR